MTFFTLLCLFTCVTGSGTVACDVDVTYDVTDVLTAGYTYSSALTPSLTQVSPASGGTAGGTQIALTGTGFG